MGPQKGVFYEIYPRLAGQSQVSSEKIKRKVNIFSNIQFSHPDFPKISQRKPNWRNCLTKPKMKPLKPYWTGFCLFIMTIFWSIWGSVFSLFISCFEFLTISIYYYDLYWCCGLLFRFVTVGRGSPPFIQCFKIQCDTQCPLIWIHWPVRIVFSMAGWGEFMERDAGYQIDVWLVGPDGFCKSGGLHCVVAEVYPFGQR